MSNPENLKKIVRVVPRSRNTELLLILFSLGLFAYELAQVQLSVLLILRSDFWLYWLPFAVVALAFHVVLRLRASEADGLLLPIALTLNGLGIAEIYRLDLAEYASGGSNLFASKQIIWTVIAVLCSIAVTVLVKNHLFLRKFVYISMVVGLALLLSPLLPIIGTEINGARLWLSVAGLTFQPGELAKIALVIFFAGYLVTRRESLSLVGPKVLGVQFPRARELGPILVIWIASLLVLVFERDLGTSILYFSLFLVMIYIATGRAFYLVIGFAMMATGALLASRFMEYVQGRVNSWLNPFDEANYDAVGGSYQLAQGNFGLAHGGILGTGLGGGLPQLVPLAESDFIISSLGEELGLAGIFAILVLYLLLIARALRVSMTHSDDFSKLLVAGLAFVIAIQIFVVVGGVTRVVPLTGLTTPLLAAGGSSLLANWIIIGLILRISDSQKARAVIE
ncbi:MAG: FtsW/RodA/SpoVE family cell cycle protein [Micrococcales bacterium]